MPSLGLTPEDRVLWQTLSRWTDRELLAYYDELLYAHVFTLDPIEKDVRRPRIQAVIRIVLGQLGERNVQWDNLTEDSDVARDGTAAGATQ